MHGHNEAFGFYSKSRAWGRRDVCVCVWRGELCTNELKVDPQMPSKGHISSVPMWPWTLARDQPPSAKATCSQGCSPSSPCRTEKSFSRMAHLWILCVLEMAS